MNEIVDPARMVPVVFPPNPTIGDVFDAPNGVSYEWDGVVWMVVGGGATGNYIFRIGLAQTGDFVDVTPATDIEIGGILEAPQDNASYVRRNADWVPSTSNLQFRGTWEVATNVPDLDPVAALPQDGDYWVAQTANYLFGETSPNLPGINGDVIWNGWYIVWNEPISQYVAINTMTLTVDDVNTIADDYVLKIGDTMIGGLTIQMAEPLIRLDKTFIGGNTGIMGSAGGLNRWGISLGDVRVEGGGNTGSAFTIGRFADNGSFIDFPLYIDRETGETTFVDQVSTPVAPTQPFSLTNKEYVDDAIANAGYVLKTGDTMTGALSIQLGVAALNLNSTIGNGEEVINFGAGTPTGQMWRMRSNGVAQNFTFSAYNAGIESVVFTINKQTQVLNFNVLPTVPVNPTNPNELARKEYVDNVIASIIAFQGLWQVAANIPDLDPAVMNPVGGWYWIAQTADPLVPEIAPPGITGIAGEEIASGDMIFWSGASNSYMRLGGTGGGMTKPEADTYYVQLGGSTMTGPLLLNEDPQVAMQAATKAYVDAITVTGFLPLAGGIMTGPIQLPGNPTQNLEAVTKQYVDAIQPLPPGGAPGTVLTKISANDGDANWQQSAAVDNSLFFVSRTPGGSTSGDLNNFTQFGTFTIIGSNFAISANRPPINTNGGNVNNQFILHNFLGGGNYLIQEAYEIPDSISGNNGIPIYTKWMRTKGGNSTSWSGWIPQPIGMPPAAPDLSDYALDADVVHLAGDTMTGPLVLSADPTDPLGAATKQYVDVLVTGAALLVGIINATTGICDFIPASGLTDGPLPPANTVGSGHYVICSVAGTLPAGEGVGLVLIVGDWLISDGATWLVLATGSSVATAPQVAMVPEIISGAANVQTTLEAIAPAIMPPGGATGFALAKTTANDFDVNWIDITAITNTDNTFINRPASGGGYNFNGDINNINAPGTYRCASATGTFPPTNVNNAGGNQWVLNHFGAGTVGSPVQEIYELWRTGGTGDYRILTKWMRNNSGTWTNWQKIPLSVDDLNMSTYATIAYADTKLAIAGGVLTGPLQLAADPTVPLGAVTKQYVDQFASNAPIVIGTIDAVTGQCLFINNTTGPVPPANRPGEYLICNNPGTIPSGPAIGIVLIRGDWLWDDGAAWVRVNVGSTGVATTADQVALVPSVHGETSVQLAMQKTISIEGNPTGPQITGPLIFAAGTPAVPSPTTRSSGTKVSLYPNTVANGFDMGIESGNMWFNTNAASNGFKFYFNSVQRYLFDQNYLTLPAAPTANMHAATKQYVDARVAKTGDTMTGELTIYMAPNTGGGLRLRKNTTTGNQATPRIRFEASDGRHMGGFYGYQLTGGGYYGTWPSEMYCFVGSGGYGEQTAWNTRQQGGGYHSLRVQGDVFARGVQLSSDVALKSEINWIDSEQAIAAFKLITPIQFHWLPVEVDNPLAAPNKKSRGVDDDPESINWGFSANNVEAAAPHLVDLTDGKRSYDLAGLVAILWAKVQDLEAQLKGKK